MNINESKHFPIRRKNILCDLGEYYCDLEEWKEAESDLVTYAIFYQGVVENWLEASLLYEYAPEEFGRTYLASDIQIEIDMSKLKSHHYEIVREHMIDKALVELVLFGKPNIDLLKNASRYHYVSLSEYGYGDKLSAISELDIESILSTFVPQMMVKILLGEDYLPVMTVISPRTKSKEKLWVAILHFLHGLSDNKSELDKTWGSVLKEWKACYEMSDYHACSMANFVWIYYLYCKFSDKAFSLKSLSEEILAE